MSRQYLSSIGKIDNGVVSVSSLWADERVYCPLEVEPYIPAHHFEGGKEDPRFRTKPRSSPRTGRSRRSGRDPASPRGSYAFNRTRCASDIMMSNQSILYFKPSRAFTAATPIRKIAWPMMGGGPESTPKPHRQQTEHAEHVVCDRYLRPNSISC